MDLSADESNAFSALLASAVGVADPTAMRVNALAAGWNSSSVSIMDLFQTAMTSGDVHGVGTAFYDDDGSLVEALDATGTTRVRDYSARMQAIRDAAFNQQEMPNIPGKDAKDSILAVRTELCELLAEAGLYAPSVEEMAPVAAPIAGAASGSQTEKKATKFTEGLNVKASDVHKKLFVPKGVLLSQDSSEEEHASEDEDAVEAVEGEEPAYPHYKDKNGRMQPTKIAPELMLSLPASQARGPAVLDTLESTDIKPLSVTSRRAALRKFSLCKGMPVRKKEEKEFPLLDIMTKAGVPGLESIQSALIKANKEVYHDMTQDVNSIYHVLNHCLKMVAAINKGESISTEQLTLIEWDVHVVAILQSQRLIAPGEDLVARVCKQLKLPAIDNLAAFAGAKSELPMEQQTKVLEALKIMISLNKAVTGNDGVQQGTKRGHLNSTPLERTDSGGEQVANTSPLGNQKAKEGRATTASLQSSKSTGRSAPCTETSAGQSRASTPSNDEQLGRVSDRFGLDRMEAIQQFCYVIDEWAIWNAERAIARHFVEDEGQQGLASETLLYSESASAESSHRSNGAVRSGCSGVIAGSSGDNASDCRDVDENGAGLSGETSGRCLLHADGAQELDTSVSEHIGGALGNDRWSGVAISSDSPTDETARFDSRSCEGGNLAQERTGTLSHGSVRDGTRIRGGGTTGPRTSPGAGSSLSGNEASSHSREWDHERGHGQRQPSVHTVYSSGPATEEQSSSDESNDGCYDRPAGSNRRVRVHECCEVQTQQQQQQVWVESKMARHTGTTNSYNGLPKQVKAKERDLATNHVQQVVHPAQAGSGSGRSPSDRSQDLRSEPLVAQNSLQGRQRENVRGSDKAGGFLLENRLAQGLPSGADTGKTQEVFAQSMDRPDSTEDDQENSAANLGSGVRPSGADSGQTAEAFVANAQSYGHSSVSGDRRFDRGGVDTGTRFQGDVHNSETAGHRTGRYPVAREVHLQPTTDYRMVRDEILLSDLDNHDARLQGNQGGAGCDAFQDVHRQPTSSYDSPGGADQGFAYEHGSRSGRGQTNGQWVPRTSSPHDDPGYVAHQRYRPRQGFERFHDSERHYYPRAGEFDRMDRGLQPSYRQGTDLMERSIQSCGSPDGDGFHRRMRVAEGSARAREQGFPGNFTPNSYEQDGCMPAHYGFGDGRLDRRSDRDCVGEESARRMHSSVRGRVGGYAIPTEQGRAHPGLVGQDAYSNQTSPRAAIDSFGVPCSGGQESSRQAFQGSGGCSRVHAGAGDFYSHEQNMGTIHDRRFRSEVEQANGSVHMLPAQRFRGGGIRFHEPAFGQDPGVSIAWDDMDVSSSSPQHNHGNYAPSTTPKVGSGGDYPVMADSVHRHGVAHVDRHATPHCSDQQVFVTSDGLPTMEQVQVPVCEPYVDLENVEESCCFTFIRKRQLTRGVDPQLAQAVRAVYKSREGEKAGRHLQGPWALLCSELKRVRGGGRVSLTDVELCNVAAANAISESGAKRILSAIRTVCRKAYGSHPNLTYDSDLKDQCVAIGKKLIPTTPKYTVGVDLSETFLDLQKQRISHEKWEAVTSETVTSKYLATHAGFMIIRNNTLFLGRLVLINRSDDIRKWDPRISEYLRCYDNQGNRIGIDGHMELSQILQEVIYSDGFVEVNYLDPKDPVKVGKFSTTTTTRPVRIEMIVDPLVPHLRTNQRVAYLCFIRSLMWLVRTMETLKMPGGQRLIDHIEPGRFWVSDNTQDVAGRPLALKASTLGSLIKKQMGKVSIDCGNDDQDTEGGKETTKLSGHFLRGHAGSLAYDLNKLGAKWQSDEGIIRARHTFETFFKNYHRPTVKRVQIAFLAKVQANVDLRFEEAALL